MNIPPSHTFEIGAPARPGAGSVECHHGTERPAGGHCAGFRCHYLLIRTAQHWAIRAVVGVMVLLLGSFAACTASSKNQQTAIGRVIAAETKVATLPPTQIAARPASASVAHSIDPAQVISFDHTDFKGDFAAQAIQIAVTVTNHDTSSHTANIQANFYDSPASHLGDDPADHLVTAGTGMVTLMAGQTTTLLINAKNAAGSRIMSVGFRAICHDSALSSYCGEHEPFQ